MEITPQIRFRGVEPTPAIESDIRERIEGLAQFHDRITACNVTIEAPHQRGRQGRIFHVRVEISVPGREIVAGREPEENHAHEDVHVAIRDAFNAAQRQLQDAVRKMSGHRVKVHPEQMSGKIDRIEREEGFGFIAASDGREFFFRRESLVSDQLWASLEAGMPVRFTEHEGDMGPYASAVSVA